MSAHGTMDHWGPTVLFLIPARALTNKGHGMYYPVYGMVSIKERVVHKMAAAVLQHMLDVI